MTEQAELFCMQYAMRRAELNEVASAFDRALAEDHRVNADMFDIHNPSITGNLHPNATMRALEKRLCDADLPFLNLLGALLAVGTDLVLDLADFASATECLEAVAAEFAVREARPREAAYLASELTSPKAEHQVKRLYAAMEQMRAILGRD